MEKLNGDHSTARRKTKDWRASRGQGLGMKHPKDEGQGLENFSGDQGVRLRSAAPQGWSRVGEPQNSRSRVVAPQRVKAEGAEPQGVKDGGHRTPRMKVQGLENIKGSRFVLVAHQGGAEGQAGVIRVRRKLRLKTNTKMKVKVKIKVKTMKMKVKS